MSRFKPGQQFVCTNKKGWVNIDTCMPSNGPKYNEQVTFLRYESKDPDYLVFIEYEFIDNEEQGYNKVFFEPLITDSQLEEELKSIEKSKTIELV